MALIELKNISYSLSGRVLLENANLIINENEKIFLLGKNGAGKTTILKMLNGEIVPDSGEILKQNGLVTGYLQQDIPEMDGSIRDVVLSGDNVGKLIGEYLHLLENDPHDNRVHELFDEIEKQDGWNLQNSAETLISRIELNPDMLYSSLSSGLKRKVLLAKALLKSPDLIILDEPTNHMDIPTVKWLEGFLSGLNKAFIVVTHDRRFLRSLASEIIELRNKGLVRFGKDFDLFLDKRDQMDQLEESDLNKLESFIKSEEYWSQRSITARRTRNEGRTRRLHDLRADRDQKKLSDGKLSFNIEQGGTSGKIVIRAKNISYAYEDKMILDNFSMIIQRNDRIGIIGPNGCGKSTLIKLLTEQMKPDSGNIEVGTKLEIAYFDQNMAILDESLAVRENILKDTDFVIINGREIHINSYLKNFLFPLDRHNSPVNSLSGGEKNRLQLAKILSKPVNFLILDEPTNDLDMETLELLEELISDFEGTVLLVSHDREFLDNVVTSSIYFTESGVTEKSGGYDDSIFINKRIAKEQNTTTVKREKIKERKLSFKEKRELEELPLLIESLEEKLAELNEKLADPEVYKEGANIVKIRKEIEDLESDIAYRYKRWDELESIG
ncbi:MAG: ATP-binding cassette domain-containing protein [Candidatus Delongbacteria bacterium]|nr:ATP-binding cassette domain-containing protein [Candidatus Delongbacteria bacterium]MBN2835258.1 ATP-binding cassette domain-containing protein [Candidatus Delongbacteria bacterium]